MKIYNKDDNLVIFGTGSNLMDNKKVTVISGLGNPNDFENLCYLVLSEDGTHSIIKASNLTESRV